jgi:endonuclease/exonuclease/phosphatase family metal-dependent hydrolase
MTFNIFHDAASDALRIAPWGIRRDMVANAIGASNADVVGLQEAYMWQVDWLVLQLPAYGHFGRGREADGSGESVTVLFKTDRFTVEESGHFWLSPTPEVPGSTGGDAWGGMSVPRIVTWARLGFTANDRELYVYNTHLPSDATGGAEARRLSTILLADRIAARSHPEVPFLLLGDFNGPDEEFPIRYLLREVQACAPSGCNGEEPESPVVVVDTWRLENSGERGTRCRNDASGTGVMHGERVDYVLVMDTMTTDTTGAARSTADGVLSAAIVAPAPSCASDHVPVLARFVVPSY